MKKNWTYVYQLVDDFPYWYNGWSGAFWIHNWFYGNSWTYSGDLTQWTKYQAKLYNTAGYSEVEFRIAYATPLSTALQAGIAIDDISIFTGN